MARKAKVDNAILKRLVRKEEKRKQALRAIRKFILIVCEGEKTEPNYFEAFKLPKGTLENYSIDIDGTGRNTLSIIEETIKLKAKRERIIGRAYDSVWAVFDKDSFPARNFNNAIEKGAHHNIKSAWPNEAFELWYLLHFQFIQHAMSRNDYKKLIEQELSQKMDGPFKYEKNNQDMFLLLKEYGNRELAMQWAESLDRVFHKQTDFANHNPCTKVYLLVRELLELD